MNMANNEEIQYCTRCGSANKKSAVMCEECGKKIIVHHRPFWDFVKKHTKGGLKEKVKSDLFDALKEFLFNHLYGTIVTFSVVGTVTAAVVTATPYIKPVSTTPAERVVVENPAEPEKRGSFELTEDDHTRLAHVLTAYDAEIDNTLRPINTYWADPEEYADASELFAENNIEGYTWQGRHDMYTNPITISLDEVNENFDWEEGKEPYGQRDWIESSAVTNENVTSSFGKELYENGYDVMECDYYLMTFRGMFDYDFDAPPPLEKNPYELLKYRFLLTRKSAEDDWYIAEEVLVERKGV